MHSPLGLNPFIRNASYGLLVAIGLFCASTSSAKGPDEISIDHLRRYICVTNDLRKAVSNNLAKVDQERFVVDRGLIKYLSSFAPEVSDEISRLGPNDRILNLGAGNMVFERQLLTVPNVAEAENLWEEEAPERHRVDQRAPYAKTALERISATPLDERPSITSVTLEATPEAMRNIPRGLDPIVGDLYSRVSEERLLNGKGKFKVGLDLYGVHHYTDTFIQDLSKTLEVMDDDGSFYIVAGKRNDFIENRVTLSDGRTEISLLDYLKSNKTIQVNILDASTEGATIRIRKRPGVKPSFKRSLLLISSDSGTPPVRHFLEYSGEGKPGFDIDRLSQTLKKPDFAPSSIAVLEKDPWLRAIYSSKTDFNDPTVKQRTLQNVMFADLTRNQFGIEKDDPSLNLALLLQDTGWSLFSKRGGNIFKTNASQPAELFADKVLTRAGTSAQMVKQVKAYLTEADLTDPNVRDLTPEKITPEQALEQMQKTADSLGIPREKYIRNLRWLYHAEQLSNDRTASELAIDKATMPEEVISRLEKSPNGDLTIDGLPAVSMDRTQKGHHPGVLSSGFYKITRDGTPRLIKLIDDNSYYTRADPTGNYQGLLKAQTAGGPQLYRAGRIQMPDGSTQAFFEMDDLFAGQTTMTYKGIFQYIPRGDNQVKPYKDQNKKQFI